jgi:hypothetical protein
MLCISILKSFKNYFSYVKANMDNGIIVIPIGGFYDCFGAFLLRR